MSGAEGLEAHLALGNTHVCRCWLVTRRDGTTYGFTDHDEDIRFDGVVFRAETGLTPGALQRSTGLSVDNVEVLGALRATALTEADIEAGRLDGAEISAWIVQWDAPEHRLLQFRGTIGEITRVAGQFRAELRGMAEALNRPQGAVFQPDCSAVLGDARCGVDLSDSAYRVERKVRAQRGRQVFDLGNLGGFNRNWFIGGRFTVLDGDAAGLVGLVRTDVRSGTGREIALWQPLGAAVRAGDRVRLEAGCDKRAQTCRSKFGNFPNFRGCPHIPGEDWQMAVPKRGGRNTGGRLRR